MPTWEGPDRQVASSAALPPTAHHFTPLLRTMPARDGWTGELGGGWKNKEEGGCRVSATQGELRNKRDSGTGNIPAVWQTLVRCQPEDEPERAGAAIGAESSRTAGELFRVWKWVNFGDYARTAALKCSASDACLPPLTSALQLQPRLFFLLVFSYCDISPPPCQLVPGPDVLARGGGGTRIHTGTDSSCADNSLAWWNG